MKKKEKQSLRSMSDAQLVRDIGKLETEMKKMSVERTTKPLKNARVFRTKRLGVAIMRTLLRERALTG
ncbi:50S ribosomal protein L29 [Candidatus Gottesmanbacteria bacterium]|nr:50S ribosomal protein L29 [Candidatus Gottesmanbacteria bacterium]